MNNTEEDTASTGYEHEKMLLLCRPASLSLRSQRILVGTKEYFQKLQQIIETRHYPALDYIRNQRGKHPTMTSLLSFDQTQTGIYIVIVTCASVSFIASSFICSTLGWAYVKTRSSGGHTGSPSTPYRRIIFGLSISDVILSFALLTGPISVPAWIPHSWGQGNDTSCDTNGFLLTFGSMGVPMYTCLLSLYYLCKLKYRMTDESFFHKIEKYFHIFIIFFNSTLSTSALALSTYHTVGSSRSYCHFATVPNGCRFFPDVVDSCDQVTTKRVDFFLLLSGILTILVFVGIIVIMCMLFLHANHLNKMTVLQDTQQKERATVESQPSHIRTSKSDCDSMSDTSKDVEAEPVRDSNISISHTSLSANIGSETSSMELPLSPIMEDGVTEIPAIRSDGNHEASDISRLYRTETILQASYFVGAFCLTYFPIVSGYIVMILLPSFVRGSNKHALMITMGMFSLGGLFNIIAYTRQHVASLKRHHPEYSRLYCQWLVLKSCGEVPKDRLGDADSDLSEAEEAEENQSSSSFSLPESFEPIRTPSYQVSQLDPISFENAKILLSGRHRRYPPPHK